MPDQHIHIGDRIIQATGNLYLASQGDRTLISASGEEGTLLMTAGQSVGLQCGPGLLSMEGSEEKTDITLQAGPLGNLKLGLGPVELGPRMVFTTESIEIAVGPPGVGASIKMTPESITLQVAEATYEMTPLGITEEVAETSRESTPVGHVLSAAESSMEITPASASIDAPTFEITAMAASENTAAASASTTGAEVSVEGAIVMIN